MRILIAGCGDIGQQLATYIHAQTQQYSCDALVGTARSYQTLKDQGLDCFQVDLDTNQAPIASADIIYYFVPPPLQGRKDTRIQAFLTQLSKAPKKFILLSTTGVYGDCQGDWITEQRPVQPQADRAYRRLDAEQQVQQYCSEQACQWLIIRVPGIYGLDKLPLKTLAKGKTILDPQESGYSNRIHSHDLVRVFWAAQSAHISNKVIHVSDGHPSSMSDYFIKVAQIFDLPAPRCISKIAALQQLSPPMLSYLLESKRLNIDAMRNELGIKPLYPNLDQGLLAIKAMM